MKINRKVLVGRVLSDKMQKTVVVAVESRKPHPLYHRIIRTRKKFKAHDEASECRQGDLVRIEECRPISKEKTWRVVTILQHREVADLQPREIGAVDGGKS